MMSAFSVKYNTITACQILVQLAITIGNLHVLLSFYHAFDSAVVHFTVNRHATWCKLPAVVVFR